MYRLLAQMMASCTHVIRICIEFEAPFEIITNSIMEHVYYFSTVHFRTQAKVWVAIFCVSKLAGVRVFKPFPNAFCKRKIRIEQLNIFKLSIVEKFRLLKP